MNLSVLETMPPEVQGILRPLVETVVANPTVAIVIAAGAACLAAWKVLAD